MSRFKLPGLSTLGNFLRPGRLGPSDAPGVSLRPQSGLSAHFGKVALRPTSPESASRLPRVPLSTLQRPQVTAFQPPPIFERPQSPLAAFRPPPLSVPSPLSGPERPSAPVYPSFPAPSALQQRPASGAFDAPMQSLDHRPSVEGLPSLGFESDPFAE